MRIRVTWGIDVFQWQQCLWMSPYREYSDEQWKQSMLTMIDVSQLQSVAYNFIHEHNQSLSWSSTHFAFRKPKSTQISPYSFFFWYDKNEQFLQLCTVVAIIRGCNLGIFGFKGFFINMHFRKNRSKSILDSWIY